MAAWAASIVLLVGCRGDPSSADVAPIQYQWAEQIDETAWTEVQPRVRLDARPLPLWYRVTVPRLHVEDPALRMSNARAVEMAFVNGRAIEMAGRPGIVPLPDADTVVWVRLMRNELHWVPRFKAGSQRALWADSISNEVPAAVVGGVMLVGGVLLLIVSLRKGGSRSYRGLGVFLAALGGITVLNLRQLNQLCPLSTTGHIYLHHALTCLYPVGFAEFVRSTFGDTRWKVILRGLWVYAAFLVVIVVLHVADIYSLRDSRDLVGLFIIAFCMEAIWLAGKSARKGDTAGKAFLFGISVLLFFGLFDLRPKPAEYQMLPFGLLAFGLAMAFLLERRFIQASDAVRAAARDLALQVDALRQRNQDVEDLNRELRHQIAERSRQMVHLLHAGAATLGEGRTLQAGDLVGDRYRVLRPLGEGGMGAVYEVERLTDERRFALKIMSGFPSPAAAARFAREAEIAARIVDEHLVAVVDVGGVETGDLFLVMELIRGRSLEDARAQFGDVSWALRVLVQIARGLAALHAAGVVHRDLKPANVLLSKTVDGAEVAKIADFGISHLASAPLPERSPSSIATSSPTSRDVRAEAETVTAPPALQPSGFEATISNAGESESQPRASGPQLTATGIIMGTPAYMAPEVVGGARSAKPSSDMFAFGLIAYELLTGKSAFDAAPGVLALAGKPMHAPRPMNDGVEKPLADLLLACLRADPNERPASARAVEVLERALADRVRAS